MTTLNGLKKGHEINKMIIHVNVMLIYVDKIEKIFLKFFNIC